MNVTFLNLNAQNKYGDSLFVMAYNGVNLRSGPFTDSPKILSLPYGTTLKYCSHSGDDQIEARMGNWIEVEYKDIAMYVFDGFLSNYSVPKSKNISVQDFDRYIKDQLGRLLLDSIEYVDKSSKTINPTVDQKKYNKIYHYETDLEFRSVKSAYGMQYEYTIPNSNSKEIINLLDLLYASYHDHTLVDHFEKKHGRMRCPTAFWFNLTENKNKGTIQFERKNGVIKLYLRGVHL